VAKKNLTIIGVCFCVSLFVLTGCRKDILTMDELVGKSETMIVKELDAPEKREVVILAAGVRLHEYQSNLYALFPKLDNQKVEIREYQWREGKYSIVIWFAERGGQWVAIDTLCWSDRVKF
jgi:hypothetical protein